MVYKNRAGQSRENAMIAAFALVTEFGAKQADVAKVLGCSQPTIANWVKDVGYRKQVSNLESELRGAKSYIKELRYEMKRIGHDSD